MTTTTPTGRFADEEVQSSYAYPKGYKVKGIAEQVQALKSLFPELRDATYDESIVTKPLPPNAEGLFAIPRWEKLGRSYGEAVDNVLTTIRFERKFYNYRDGQLGAEYLRQHAKTVKMFQKLGDEQKDHDILVVPAQFGLRHRGRSVRRAREVIARNSSEFGLDAFAVGIMLLTHPERLQHYDDLWIDCPGDEYDDVDVDRFARAPIFYFHDDKVTFGANRLDYADRYCGSATGFVAE